MFVCMLVPHKERPSQQSNNNGKFLGLPKSARIHRTPSSSGNSTNIDSVSMEDNSSTESSFTELNHCGSKHQYNNSGTDEFFSSDVYIFQKDKLSECRLNI